MVSYSSGVIKISNEYKAMSNEVNEKLDSLLNIIIASLGRDAVRNDSHYPDTIPSFLVPRERFIDAARGMKKAGARLVAEWATDERNMEITLPFKGRDMVGMGDGIYTCFFLDSEYIIVN